MFERFLRVRRAGKIEKPATDRRGTLPCLTGNPARIQSQLLAQQSSRLTLKITKTHASDTG